MFWSDAAGQCPSGASPSTRETLSGADLLCARMERHGKRARGPDGPDGQASHWRGFADPNGLKLASNERAASATSSAGERGDFDEHAPEDLRRVKRGCSGSSTGSQPGARFIDSGTASVVVGAPLNRAPKPELQRLGNHLRGLERLIECEYPLVEPDRELTGADFRYLRSLPETLEGVTCKRAALLLGLFAESGVGLRLAAADAAEGAGAGPRAGFVEDMDTRVLPVTVQHYINGVFQDPDVFVLLSTVLHCMWSGEDLRLFDFQSSAP